MNIFFMFLIFIFGAAVGSFVNVVADRYNTGLKWWRGKSFCFACNQNLRARDLFPIFSFLFLRGRCRYCNSKIPRSSLLIEILMGVLLVLAAFKSGLLGLELGTLGLEAGISYFILTATFATILLISIYDLRHFIIPDSFLVFLFILAISSKLLSSSFISFSLSFKPLALSLSSGLILTLPFLILFLVSKGRWLGLGDVKYIAVIGFGLGLVKGVSAILLAFWIAAGFALILLFVAKKNLTMKSEVPFGPFLSLGFVLAWFLEFDLLHLNDFWLNL